MNNPHFNLASSSRPQLVDEDLANEGYLAREGVTNETMQFSALSRIAEATLALAYEQKTANLLAAYTYGIVGPSNESVDESTIITRLGLGDTK